MSPHVLAALSTDDIHPSVLYVFSLYVVLPDDGPEARKHMTYVIIIIIIIKINICKMTAHVLCWTH